MSLSANGTIPDVMPPHRRNPDLLAATSTALPPPRPSPPHTPARPARPGHPPPPQRQPQRQPQCRPPLRRQKPRRLPLPRPRHDQRPLPLPRGKIHRPALAEGHRPHDGRPHQARQHHRAEAGGAALRPHPDHAYPPDLPGPAVVALPPARHGGPSRRGPSGTPGPDPPLQPALCAKSRPAPRNRHHPGPPPPRAARRPRPPPAAHPGRRAGSRPRRGRRPRPLAAGHRRRPRRQAREAGGQARRAGNKARRLGRHARREAAGHTGPSARRPPRHPAAGGLAAGARHLDRLHPPRTRARRAPRRRACPRPPPRSARGRRAGPRFHAFPNQPCEPRGGHRGAEPRFRICPNQPCEPRASRHAPARPHFHTFPNRPREPRDGHRTRAQPHFHAFPNSTP